MLDSPISDDQNMVVDQTQIKGIIFPGCIYVDVFLFSGIHQICIPTFPFDPPTQSDTLQNIPAEKKSVKVYLQIKYHPPA